jgi:hypothetical protein
MKLRAFGLEGKDRPYQSETIRAVLVRGMALDGDAALTTAISTAQPRTGSETQWSKMTVTTGRTTSAVADYTAALGSHPDQLSWMTVGLRLTSEDRVGERGSRGRYAIA